MSRRSYRPPASVARAAARGLELRKKAGGKGGLDTRQASAAGVGSGVQRATNLKNRTQLSAETVRRMHRFFQRHRKNKTIAKGKKPHEDKGHVAWLLWGGDPGAAWAARMVRQMDESRHHHCRNNLAEAPQRPLRRKKTTKKKKPPPPPKPVSGNFYKPPGSVAQAAFQGLRLKAQSLGVPVMQLQNLPDVNIRKAFALKNRDELSLKSVRAMNNYFVDYKDGAKTHPGKEPHEDRGHVSWLMRGGHPGAMWAADIVRKVRSGGNKNKGNAVFFQESFNRLHGTPDTDD